ncbi:MAG: putative ABC transport system permease protein [Verrucomicrobiales bacterium]|jgi:putative ABC transport system permease protein
MFKIILRSLRHYWRTHLAVLAGVFVASTVLTGALFVGDSVKASLRLLIEERSGGINAALLGNDRFFSQALAAKVSEATQTTVLPVMQVLGTVADETGSVRVNALNVMGVPDTFWNLRGRGGTIEPGQGWINEALAAKLGVKVGDTIIARVEQPGAISRDAPLSGEADAVVPLRLDVGKILTSAEFGNYSLKAEQTAPSNLFVPLVELAKSLDKVGRANLLLIKGEVEAEALETAIDTGWTADDTDLALHEREGEWELVSRRVLMDWRAEEIVRETAPQGHGVFTYLIDGMKGGNGETPYSMVAAVSPGDGPLPYEMPEDQVVINQWMADDLGICQGAEVTLSYNVFSPGRKLEPRSSVFTVNHVIPMDHPTMHARWTPDFPGVSEADNCRDWKPGIPVDLEKIRDKDETYWDEFKGTPKAFITLGAGQKLWSNRFGQLTSYRFPKGFDGEAFKATLDAKLKPGEFGVHAIDLDRAREQAVTHSLDFGMYLSALSYFIIIAAIILTVLLFALGLDQRESQFGTMRALGFKPGKVRMAYFMEGGIVALIGGVLGILGGLGYTKAMIAALSTVWQDAIGGLQIVFAPAMKSGVMGAYGMFFMACLAMIFATRRISKRSPVQLMTGAGAASEGKGQDSKPLLKRKTFWGCVLTGVMAVGSLLAGGGQTNAMVQTISFFMGGMLTLVAGLLATSILLGNARRWLGGRHDLASLGVRNSARKRGRSLSVIIIMAAGVFMVCATSAFRQETASDTRLRSAGTGGFQYLGESSMPIYEDLNDPKTREVYGLDDEELDFSVVPFRVRDGEEASCLNLNQAQRPRLMAVKPKPLIEREAFTFQAKQGWKGEGSPWGLLSQKLEDGVIPGIMDYNSATYALKIKLGQEVIYEDELGRPLRIRLVGVLQNTILQGSMLISEGNFLDAFPNAGGYRYFLMDSSPEGAEELSASMTRMLGDRGLSLTTTADRLNAFNNVQNTYLKMFSTLGGLGLLLGTVGLAVVTFRNILERRGELALMEAVGFTRPRLSWLVMSEHWFLHAIAVLLGALAAFLAIYPALTASGQALPVKMIGGMLVLIFIGGLLFCWLAARTVFKQPLLESLRHE